MTIGKFTALVCIVAIICITGLACLALHTGINGVLYASSVAAIVGIPTAIITKKIVEVKNGKK